MTLLNFLTNAYPVSLYEVRQANPNVSFPANPTDEDLQPFGYINVHPTPQPSHDPRTQRIEGPTAAPDAEGVYRQQWAVRDATAGEIAAYDEANPPAPRWVEFGGAVQASVLINQLLGTALQQVPALGLGLGVGLGKAADGDARVFISSWAIANAMGMVSAALLEEVTGLAEQFDLPPEFVAALDPAPEPGLIRARDEQGRFIADDPATPQNEAWTSAD